MNNYNIESISHLDTREAMRARINMYLGSNDTDGIYQAFKEIINNSTDEALAGYGNKITITIDEPTNTITIEDEGRGVPFGERNGKNILVAIYTESHTGGKFDKNSYKNSSGLNGIGGTAVCMSSEYFMVESTRDNKIAIAKFNKGILENYQEKEYQVEKTGTKITFRPDREVFSDMTDGFSFDRICTEIKNISYLNKGIYFTIKDTKGHKKEFYSKNGIADFIKENSVKPLMKSPIVFSAKDDVDEIEIAFMYTAGHGESYVFVNGLYCPENGSPVTGAKTAITNSIKKLSGKDFDSELTRKGLVYAINCKVTNPSFANQTKSKINNPNLRTLASQAFKSAFEEFALRRKDEFNQIVDLLIKSQRAERAAEKAREAILNGNNDIQKELKKKVILAEKLADCRRHDESSQLMICEGKSAKGALVKARNSETTACFDLRGKIINALKNPEEKVSLNYEVKQLHIALGCGIGDKFNIKKLRYGKIVIVADMDKDGYDIVCLVLTFFYHYYPELIKAGKVYWGVTPLFKIESGNKKYFAYNEKELKNMPKGEITRLKGLGESQPEDFRATIFSNNSHLVQIKMDDAEKAQYYFDILLGEDIKSRKEYIFEHANFDNLED